MTNPHFTQVPQPRQDGNITSTAPCTKVFSTEVNGHQQDAVVILSLKSTVNGKLRLIWFGLSTGMFIKITVSKQWSPPSNSTGVNSEGGGNSAPLPSHSKRPSEWLTLRAAAVPAPGLQADVREQGLLGRGRPGFSQEETL